MKIFLLDLWHDLRAKRLWPVAAVLAVGAGRGPGGALEVGGDAAGPAGEAARERRPIRTTEGARERQAGRGRRGPRLVARHLRPEQPVPAAEAIEKRTREGAEGAASTVTSESGDRRRRRLDRRRRRRRHRLDGRRRHRLHRRRRHRLDRRRHPDHAAQYRYVVDLTFTANGRNRHIKSMERLEMLPNEASPLLLFLGVSANAGNAVFLVDSTLDAAGEGKCKPRASECAFLVHRCGLGARVHERGRRLVHPPDRRDPEGAGGRQRRRRQPHQDAPAPRSDRPREAAASLSAARRPGDRVQRRRRQIQPTIRTVDRGIGMRRLLFICLLALSAGPGGRAGRLRGAGARAEHHPRDADARERRQPADGPRT